MSEESTHGLRMSNGRHKGELVTRVPVSYLQWMVRDEHKDHEIAMAELQRRGTTFPRLEVSHHAIDRASIRLWRVWRKDRDGEEGLHHWLHRVALRAWDSQDSRKPPADVLKRDGIRFVFEATGAWPLLKTVMHADRR